MQAELSSRRLRRSLLILAFLIVAVVAVVALVPGLESLRESFPGARPGWLAIAAGLEVLSCLSYVIVFRGVFCPRARWVTSYEIGTAELTTNSVLSVGGAGGLALGALYHALDLWVPIVLGVPSLASLRRRPPPRLRPRTA